MNQRKRSKRNTQGAPSEPDSALKYLLISTMSTGTSQVRKVLREEAAATRAAIDASANRGRVGRTVANVVTVIFSAAAVVAAVASLIVAVDASSRDELTVTFGSSTNACIRLEPDLTASARAVTYTGVITNTGRLPITVVSVWIKDVDQDDFYWVRLDDVEQTGENKAVELGVGQAIAVRIIAQGSTLRLPPAVLTSDGTTRDLEQFPGPADTTAAVAAAFERLPECRTGAPQ